MTVFAAAASVGVILRVYEQLLCIDKRGFVKSSYSEKNFFLLLICVALLLISAVAGGFIRRCPEKPPKLNIPLCSSALLLGGWMGFESLTSVSPASIPSWQPMLMNLFGVLSALLFIAYALSPVFNRSVPGFLFALPVVFMMARLIWTYTALNTLPLTVEHTLLLLACAASLVFMLQFAKLMCGTKSDMQFKYIMISGICTVILNLYYAVPNIVSALLGIKTFSRESGSSEILLLLTAAFTLSFLLSYFNMKNLRRHHRHHSHGYTFSDSPAGNYDYYIGDTK